VVCISRVSPTSSPPSVPTCIASRTAPHYSPRHPPASPTSTSSATRVSSSTSGCPLKLLHREAGATARADQGQREYDDTDRGRRPPDDVLGADEPLRIGRRRGPDD